MQEIVQVSQLVKNYKDIEEVKGINFSVRQDQHIFTVSFWLVPL